MPEHKPKILVVEYEQHYAQPLIQTLTSRGYEVKLVETGNEAAAELGIEIDYEKNNGSRVTQLSAPLAKYDAVIVTGGNYTNPDKDHIGGLDFVSALNRAVEPQDGHPSQFSKKDFPPIIAFSALPLDWFSRYPVVSGFIKRHPYPNLFADSMKLLEVQPGTEAVTPSMHGMYMPLNGKPPTILEAGRV